MTRDDVLQDLRQLHKLGVPCAKAIQQVSNGKYDDIIKESECQKVCEVSDTIIELVSIL